MTITKARIPFPPFLFSFGASALFHTVIVGGSLWTMYALYHSVPFERIATMNLVSVIQPRSETPASAPPATPVKPRAQHTPVPATAPTPAADPVAQTPEPAVQTEPINDAVTDAASTGATESRGTPAPAPTPDYTGQTIDAEKIDGGLTALFKPAIPYPPRAVDLGVTGTFDAILLVNTQGLVDSVGVVSSPHRIITTEALKTMKKWKFKPARYKGFPVAVKVRQTIEFNLE